MNETTLDEIMKCSKEAIARAYMCQCHELDVCTVGGKKCPFEGASCSDITIQDWEKVLNSAQEKRNDRTGMD